MYLSKKTKEFLNTLNGLKPLYELSPQNQREFLESLQNKYKTEIKNLESFNSKTGIKVYLIKPDKINDNYPIILYVHGGGWVLGSINSWGNFVNKLSLLTGCIVVFPEYTLSPEAKFPQALNEIYFIYKELENFGLKNKKVIIAGDSAGANMATVCARRAAKENIPFIFQLLFYPVTSALMNTKSYTEFEDGPWLSKRSMEYFFNALLADNNLRENKEISPLLLNEDELSILPETLIITAQNDVLKDEGMEYAKKLDSAGVKTTSVQINGTCHDFMILNALQDTEEAREGLLIAVEKIKSLFS